MVEPDLMKKQNKNTKYSIYRLNSHSEIINILRFNKLFNVIIEVICNGIKLSTHSKQAIRLPCLDREREKEITRIRIEYLIKHTHRYNASFKRSTSI